MKVKLGGKGILYKLRSSEKILRETESISQILQMPESKEYLVMRISA